MDLRIFLRALRSKALVIVAAMLLTAGAVFGITGSMTPTYEATARLIVGTGLGIGGVSNDTLLAAPRIGQTYAALAVTHPVLLDVIRRSGVDYDPGQLGRLLNVTAGLDLPIITITMTDPVPATAASVANAMAASLVELATNHSVAGSAPTSLLSVIESAAVPTNAVLPRPLFDAVLSAVAVFVTALVLLASVLYLRADRGAGALKESA